MARFPLLTLALMAFGGIPFSDGFALLTPTVPGRSPTHLLRKKELPQKIHDWTTTYQSTTSIEKEPQKLGASKKLLQLATLAVSSYLVLGPFALTFFPYAACLAWGLPTANKLGNKKSALSNGHRLGGIGILALPLALAAWDALLKAPPPSVLYGLAVAMATSNLVLGGAMITRRVPAYDIPTLRAFATGVLLGFSFLGSSLSFALGQNRWYHPIGVLFSCVAAYATIFACSDALQHVRLFLLQRMKQQREHSRDDQKLVMSTDGRKNGRRFWYLPFERSKLRDVFFTNLWRQPTEEALEATVSPANGVVVFTTTMTAVFACLGLLQLRYSFNIGGQVGAAGMKALWTSEPTFCRWSMYQALLAVVANNFGTFAGTLVIQRRTTQKRAGLFNAIGLLIPVMNILALLLQHPEQFGKFHRLMLLLGPASP